MSSDRVVHSRRQCAGRPSRCRIAGICRMDLLRNVFTLRGGPCRVRSIAKGVLVSLSAQNFTVTVDGTAFDMQGREGVFAAVSDWMYLPVGSQVAIAGTSGEVAIVTARASQAFPVHYGSADSVAVEVRGAGRATRR